jgi:hypothetical protein
MGAGGGTKTASGAAEEQLATAEAKIAVRKGIHLVFRNQILLFITQRVAVSASGGSHRSLLQAFLILQEQH